MYILQDGMTPLMHCAFHGYMQQCSELISKGANVNDNNQKDGVSYACSTDSCKSGW